MSARLTVLLHEQRAVQALSACPDIRIQLEAAVRWRELQCVIEAEQSGLPGAANFARRDADPDERAPLSPAEKDQRPPQG